MAAAVLLPPSLLPLWAATSVPNDILKSSSGRIVSISVLIGSKQFVFLISFSTDYRISSSKYQISQMLILDTFLNLNFVVLFLVMEFDFLILYYLGRILLKIAI